ncbi:hypothetical protein HY500_04505, partial [Candidatus Woesearchaeota archaeon]|nr:hypothetical protein [Candidatus Woesearchaeota archaeon]
KVNIMCSLTIGLSVLTVRLTSGTRSSEGSRDWTQPISGAKCGNSSTI